MLLPFTYRPLIFSRKKKSISKPWFLIMVKSYINHQFLEWFCFTASFPKLVSLPVLSFIFGTFVLLHLDSPRLLIWYVTAYVPGSDQ
ncbi:hypothetical protein XENTR_v10007943 [Xenopus tropicalis]|nr:hypothetical protein XENTR_v10007943 [Xenopus tropicalis]